LNSIIYFSPKESKKVKKRTLTSQDAVSWHHHFEWVEIKKRREIIAFLDVYNFTSDTPEVERRFFT